MSDEKNREPFSDDQSDGTPRSRPEKTTGAGAEATEGMEGEPKGASHKHRSAYGGEGGEPKEPNDFPRSRR